jgi:hypothetical protein
MLDSILKACQIATPLYDVLLYEIWYLSDFTVKCLRMTYFKNFVIIGKKYCSCTENVFFSR